MKKKETEIILVAPHGQPCFEITVTKGVFEEGGIYKGADEKMYVLREGILREELSQQALDWLAEWNKKIEALENDQFQEQMDTLRKAINGRLE